MPAVPLYARTFGVSLTAIGLTIAGLRAGPPPEQPAGRPDLGPLRPDATPSPIGGLITVVGNILCALATTYEPFLAARFIAGLGAGFILTASQIMLADISTPDRRGRIMATYSGVFGFAVGLGPLAGGMLAERFGLAAPFWALRGHGALAAVLAWFRVPETRTAADGRQRPAERSARGAGRPPKLSFLAQVRLMTRAAPASCRSRWSAS